MRHWPRHCRNARTGPAAPAFTLIESLWAVMLVAVAAVAFCDALTAGARQNEAATRSVVATHLAAALMNEIVARPFREAAPAGRAPGPEPGELTHAGFSVADDYHGLVEPAGQMRGPDGVILADASLAGYSRSATAAYVNLPGRDPGLPQDFLLVSVEVKHNGTSLVTLKRLISSQERR